MYVCVWSYNAVLYYTWLYSCRSSNLWLDLYEIYTSRLNTLGAGDSTGIVRSSPLYFFSPFRLILREKY